MYYDNLVFINGYDLIIFGFILLINLILVGFNLFPVKNKWIGCLFWLLVLIVYGFIFPICSISIEARYVHVTNDVVDAFNLLYLYLKFPIYWFVAVVQLVFFSIMVDRKKKKLYHADHSIQE